MTGDGHATIVPMPSCAIFSMKLPKSRIIRSTNDFATVRKRGKTQASGGVLLGMMLRDRRADEPTRFGFVTPKYLGGAVVRNLVRRRLKHIVIELGDQCALGFDVVMIARRSAATTSYARLKNDFFRAAQRSGLLESKRGGAQ